MSAVAGAGRDDRWEPPEPGHPQRLALPAHLRPAAAALFDDLPEVLPGLVAEGADARLDARAGDLAQILGPGADITVDAFRIRRVTSCPAAAVDDDAPFTWTAATAARTIGLRAVAFHLRGDVAGQGPGGARGRPVESAIEAVVADLMAGGGERGPGPWLADLPPPARGVALAHARRWAEQAVAWLPLRLVGDHELRFLQDDWWPPRSRAAARGAGGCGGPGGRGLVVHGRRDITVDAAGRRVAVTVAGGAASDPGLAEVDALTALAALLCDPRGRLVRVVRIHPASGEVAAVDVTAALVERAVEVVSDTAAVLAEIARGEEAKAVPGPGCTWCHRREACRPGRAWLGRADRRSMGLPLLARRV